MNQFKRVVGEYYNKLLGETSHKFDEAKALRVSQLINSTGLPNQCIAGVAEVFEEEIKKTIFFYEQQ